MILCLEEEVYTMVTEWLPEHRLMSLVASSSMLVPHSIRGRHAGSEVAPSMRTPDRESSGDWMVTRGVAVRKTRRAAAGPRGAVPQEGLWASERLAAEPRIRSNRAQRKIFRPFLKIDLMDPNRTRPVRQQDLLGEGLLLR